MKLRLYVIARSKGACEVIQCVKDMLDEAFQGQYAMEVIDILENPGMAEQDKIFVTPLLYKMEPAPARKVMGDFSDKKRLLQALIVNPLERA